MARRILRILLIVLAWLAGLVVLAALAGLVAVRSSLPRLDGERRLEALQASVTVARDSLGVPDIAAASRRDAAVALGYLHGQERFFQMDLQRRSAAGELAALVGGAVLDSDRDVRRHRFRAKAAEVVAAFDPATREVVDAYVAGVNAGLTDLRTPPFEYLLLRRKPRPWRAEDSVLVLYAMYLDLTFSSVQFELQHGIVRDTLPAALVDFLMPRSGRWEAPLQTDPVPGVQIPDSNVFDVRDWTYSGKSHAEFRAEYFAPDTTGAAGDEHRTAGSNAWAVAGRRTRHGAALLANDMHLGFMLPNTWYRARMSWPEGPGTRSVIGATLPGTPPLIQGSNGEVAWGFTTSYGDWCDLVRLEVDEADSTRYRTPDGWRAIERIPEIIEVARSDPDTLWIEQTIWGPIWEHDTAGGPLALRCTAHDVEAINFELMKLESVSNVDEVAALAGAFGVPGLDLVYADADGRVGWSLIGRLPRRVGFDGRLPVSWADGSCRWDGYLDPAEQPRRVDPPGDCIWLANNRVAAGEDLARIGDAGYATGARARQIRDGLRALDSADETDMLALQLDDRALFYGEWRELALAALERPGAADDSLRAEYLRIVRDEWPGRALPDAAAYRLVSTFAYECVRGVYDFLTKPCVARNPAFRSRWLNQRYALTWEVIAAHPPHLLAPWFADWDDFLLQAVDETIAVATRDGRRLRDYTRAERVALKMEHPLVRAVPQLRRWLAVPPLALPGDSLLPRVQHDTWGASQRMVVAPGREQDGIWHMPGGQSGHPLSPYFLAGHEAWVTGRATPLLPGPAEHELRLAP